MKKRYCLIVSILFNFFFFGITTSQMFGEEPIERERSYDVEHMKMEVKLDLEKKTIDGRITTSFRSLVDHLKSFKIDAVGMNIKSVKCWIHNATDDPKLAEDFENIKYAYDNKEITVELPGQGLAKNYPYKYQVEYSITDPEKGLYFIQPSETFPGKSYQVWSQGEGEDNRYWIPCYDYPNEKQTTEMDITVDSRYQTLSNGIMKNEKVNSDGTTTWQWVLDKPQASYLIMIAAGNWDVIEDSWNGIPVLSYVPVGQKENAFKSFDRTADMLHFFSGKINFLYPWTSFSQVVVEDFIYGGMENTGVVVLTDASLYDDKTPPDYSAINLVAHELAHQWWGDALTCRNWHEIWLNESFATYFQCLYTEYAFGKDEFDYNIYRNGRDAIIADSTIARKPIYTRQGLTVNTYDKGSVVLNMLRNLIGDEKFWKAMNVYITENQYKCVSSQDLVSAIHKSLDAGTPQLMPPDIRWFFNEWIYRAGQPEFDVSYTFDNETKKLELIVRQVQKLDSSSVFKTPVPVRVVSSYGTVYDRLITTDTSAKTYAFDIDNTPNYVLFNKGNTVLCKVHFNKPKQDWLNQWLNSEDAIDRITAIQGIRDLTSDSNVLAALESALTKDRFWGVRNETAVVLGRANFYTALEILMSAYEKETDPRVRRTILGSIAGVSKNSSEQVNINWLYGKVKDMIDKEQSKYTIADGINAISGILEKKDIFDAVIPYMQMDSHNEVIRRSVIAALDLSGDERSLKYFLEYGEKGSTSRLRNAAVNGLHRFLDDPSVIDYLNNKVLEHTRSTQYVVLGLIEKANNTSSIPYLQILQEKSNDDRFKKRIKEVIDKLH